MVEAWYAIFWMMIGMYVILDGRTLGAGAVRLTVSSNADERRQVLDAIGPMWSWYEVWLVGAGGVLMLAFPIVLAAGFSGYYLALFLVLWLLVLRGIAIEFGRHFEQPLWNSFWDVVLTASSAALLLLFGVAFGNVVRGVPVNERGEFHMAFFTDFGVRGNVGLLDWYTLSAGLLALAGLSAHGATFITTKTTGIVQARSRALGGGLWLATLALGLLFAIETWVVRPDLSSALVSRPLCWGFLLFAGAGAAGILYAHRPGRDRGRWAFTGSCALIAGIVGARASAAFPELLHSTLDPAQTLSAYSAATRHQSLVIGLVWFAVALPLAGLWHVLATRSFRGKASSERAHPAP
jgi:cytochrome d ubiquinol oxidase subunit II